MIVAMRGDPEPEWVHLGQISQFELAEARDDWKGHRYLRGFKAADVFVVLWADEHWGDVPGLGRAPSWLNLQSTTLKGAAIRARVLPGAVKFELSNGVIGTYGG